MTEPSRLAARKAVVPAVRLPTRPVHSPVVHLLDVTLRRYRGSWGYRRAKRLQGGFQRTFKEGQRGGEHGAETEASWVLLKEVSVK